MTALTELQSIAEIEFSDIVTFSEISKNKLRLYLTDGSFIDIWLSKKVLGHYAFHWERGNIMEVSTVTIISQIKDGSQLVPSPSIFTTALRRMLRKVL
ncbi:hypothetical protein M1N59_01280 [Dehalococcoidales bacterium]|nr:hypothetical protein [Dehalococcoidales bacterium]